MEDCTSKLRILNQTAAAAAADSKENIQMWYEAESADTVISKWKAVFT